MKSLWGIFDSLKESFQNFSTPKILFITHALVPLRLTQKRKSERFDLWRSVYDSGHYRMKYYRVSSL